jgi:hypothetical protein
VIRIFRGDESGNGHWHYHEDALAYQSKILQFPMAACANDIVEMRSAMASSLNSKNDTGAGAKSKMFFE